MIALRIFCVLTLTASYVNGYLRLPIAFPDIEILKSNEALSGGDFWEHLIIQRVNGSIGTVTLSTYPNIESLSIEYSNINEVEDGALCKRKMTDLLISKNKIFPPLTEGILSNCEAVKQFETDVQVFPSTFNHMPKVQKLSLSQQKIKRLNKEYFEPMKQLGDLTLRNCEFDEVDPNALCSNIERIQMLGTLNPVTRSYFENCTNLRYLSILYFADNPNYQSIEVNSFNQVPNLKELELFAFNIEHLTKSMFRGLTNLESLALNKCNIKIIDQDAFEELKNLTQLSLRSNSFKQIDSAIFRDVNLRSLDLSGNSFETLDDLPKLSTLTQLTMEHNSIASFDLDHLKDKFPRLENINVQGNPLELNFIHQLFEIKPSYVKF